MDLQVSKDFLYERFGRQEVPEIDYFAPKNKSTDARDPHRTTKSHALRGGGYYAENEYWTLRIGKGGEVHVSERRGSIKLESGEVVARFDRFCTRMDCRAPARHRLIEEHQEIIDEANDIARRRNMKAALGALRVKMESAWEDPLLNMQEKEKALYDLWVACAEDVMGRRAKRAIQVFVAERFSTATLQLFDRS